MPPRVSLRNDGMRVTEYQPTHEKTPGAAGGSLVTLCS